MLTLDPYTATPGTILDQLFEVKSFASKQVSLLSSAVKFDVVWQDGTVSEVRFDIHGSQIGVPIASQVYENWFQQEGSK